MGGGLVTRPSDNHIEGLAKGKLYGIDLGNSEYQELGSLQKRDQLYLANPSSGQNVGVVDARLAITVTDTKITTDNYATFSAYVSPATSTAANTVAVCFKFTAGASRSVAYVRFNQNFAIPSSIWKNIKVAFRAAGANPGAVVGQSSDITVDAYDVPANYNTWWYYFPTPPALVSGTDYWVCFQADSSASGQTFTIATPSASNIFTTQVPNHGLYDYKVTAAGVTTQFPMAMEGDTLYYNNGSGYTSLTTGLASTSNDLFDFETMKNILFVSDNATTKNLMWDGAQSTTSTAGYRGTFSIGQSASAGGPWSAAGIVKVMLVTQLVSGGYRSSAVATITLAGTTNKIDLTSIAIDAIAAQFSTFDILALATTVYCTLPNGSIYYKVPAAYMTAGGINPIANNDTTESILPMTDAQLIAGGSIESNLTLPTGYFTDQVACPKSRGMIVFQDFLVSFGDPNYPSSIWVTEQYAPNIWSTYGASYGFRIDVNTDDGEIVTGLGVTDGSLFVTKQHNVFRVDSTGDFNDPLKLRLVHGQIGCLSHFSIETIPDGMFFLSEQGPAICYGNYTRVLDQTVLIQNLFSNLNASGFDLASARYSVACNDTTRNQVIMTMSRGQVDVNGDLVLDSTIRDCCLVYDYEQKLFSIWPQVNLNYVAIISDTHNFPVMWGGDLSGFVFKRFLDTTGSTPGSTKPYPFYFVTPSMSLGSNTYYKEGVFLTVAGTVMDSGYYLIVDVFLDGSSTARASLVYDMSKTRYRNGIPIPVPGKFQNIKLRFRHTSANRPDFMIDWVDFTFETEGLRL